MSMKIVDGELVFFSDEEIETTEDQEEEQD